MVPMTAHTSNIAAIAQALADPLRLAILHRLMEGGAAVGELVAVTGTSQPNVSNHLRILREHGLVEAERTGRQMTYALANSSVAHLVEALTAVASGPKVRDRRTDPVLMQARTCYDHFAGTLGVWLYDRLVDLEAIEAVGEIRGDVALGRHAERWLSVLGVDAEAAARTKRRFAFGCLDWTERRPHLGGALAAQMCEQALARGWVARIPGTRAVRITSVGRAGFGALGAVPGPEGARASVRSKA